MSGSHEAWAKRAQHEAWAQDALMQYLGYATAPLDDIQAARVVAAGLAAWMVTRYGPEAPMPLGVLIGDTTQAVMERLTATVAPAAERPPVQAEAPDGSPVVRTRDYGSLVNEPWNSDLDAAPINDDRELLLKREGVWEGARATRLADGTWSIISRPERMADGNIYPHARPMEEPTHWKFSGGVVERSVPLDAARALTARQPQDIGSEFARSVGLSPVADGPGATDAIRNALDDAVAAFEAREAAGDADLQAEREGRMREYLAELDAEVIEAERRLMQQVQASPDIPAPPGTGEVDRLDPLQGAVQSLRDVRPLRDNGNGAPASAEPSPPTPGN